jgi:hypothetical protein
MLRYWKEVALAGALFLLAVASVRHDHDVAETAAAKVLLRQADSALTVSNDALRNVDIAIEHDTLVLTKTLTRLKTDTLFIHDTIYAPSDTAHEHPLVPVPAGTLTELESLAPKCTALLNDCKEYHAWAEKRFAEYETKLTAKTHIAPACTGAKLEWGTVGAAAGYLLHGVLSR